jgi:hypothetical protein
VFTSLRAVTSGVGVGVVEFDPVGHRLAFVAGLLDEAHRAGIELRVVTTAAARDSPEWSQHIGSVAAPAAVQLESVPGNGWRYARLIARVSPCVVLESDAHLPALVLARVMGAEFGMLVTRPITPRFIPRWRWRTRGKAALCLVLRALGVNVRLLVSPFASTHPWAEVAIPVRLHLPLVVDPPLVLRSGRSRAHARVALAIDRDATVWAVAGAINYTKGLPTIFAAMESLAPEHHLVVAGKQDAADASKLSIAS